MRMSVIKKKFARTLRKRQTESEKKVWKVLRDRRCTELKFICQHVVEGFILDFYCDKLKLGIEVDGGIHDNREAYDKARDAVLQAEGIRMLRVKNHEIERDPKSIVKRIWEILEEDV